MSPRMIRLLVIASIVGVFLGGVVVGYVVGHRSVGPVTATEGRPPPGRERLLDQFTDELGLSPAQRSSIEQLMRDGERNVRETMARVRPELEAKRETIERGILEILTPEQRTRYREMLPHGLPRPPPLHGRPPPPHGGPPPP